MTSLCFNCVINLRLAEYYADEDFLTENWNPRSFERKPELFAEWAVSGGLDGHSRRQHKDK